MKSPKLRRPLTLALFAVAATSLSSCNRGMGCPTNFSIGDTVDVLTSFAAAVLPILF